ncbi:MAG: hypothetical protein HOP08_15730 [Cyclobacteriaceae bacterium]|nr:hypothetical protein [Cyclobacteriaceae bacterium]
MKSATVSEIKKELKSKEDEELRELVFRLAKYKKDNKELLTYLLFESEDENSYVQSVMADMEEMFGEVSRGNIYFAKKTLRKILRMANKQIRYSGNKQTELEIRIRFCTLLKDSGIRYKSSQVLVNLYQQQLKKIHATLTKLPEDLQYDYLQAIANLA